MIEMNRKAQKHSYTEISEMYYRLHRSKFKAIYMKELE